MNAQRRLPSGYDFAIEEKANGAVYTPTLLADFVAKQIVDVADAPSAGRWFRILDPAVGDGELLVSLLKCLPRRSFRQVKVCGFETDPAALDLAQRRMEQDFPEVTVDLHCGSFLEFAIDQLAIGDLFSTTTPARYDVVIANPPYVRTQAMGAKQAQILSHHFDLSGRSDLYHAFVLAILQVLAPRGTAGVIVSNRFMTTKSGGSIRQALSAKFNLHGAWDLGDTKLFDAAVLPAILLLRGSEARADWPPAFTSIYETSAPADTIATDPLAALNQGEGVVAVRDGRRFHVRRGRLSTNGTPDGVWRIATRNGEAWLRKVEDRTWGRFRDIGRVRVGVKTCADKVFIRRDWSDMPDNERPELLRRLSTHRLAQRFRAKSEQEPSEILYPHEVIDGRRRAVDLDQFPKSRAYLTEHRRSLERRTYLIQGNRKWYEIWVPQDPGVWDQPKLVFRDISDQATFWVDLDGTVVNGDCYWLAPSDQANLDLLWLAVAVANSTLAERFYDLRFHNKLYAGRRRFITQYVEEFPVPNPHTAEGQAIIAMAKRIYEATPSRKAACMAEQLDAMVWSVFCGEEG